MLAKGLIRAQGVGKATHYAVNVPGWKQPDDQRLSAALTNPAKVKAFNAADEPRWTEPLLVKELTLAV